MSKNDEVLAGIWVDGDGVVHRAWRAPSGETRETEERFVPFAWMRAVPPGPEWKGQPLSGSGFLGMRASSPDTEAFESEVKGLGNAAEVLRPYEHQVLVTTGERLFAGMPFLGMKRCQLKIATMSEVAGEPGDPTRKGDRVVAIALSFAGDDAPVLLEIEELNDASERTLIKRFLNLVAERDPDVIEGHGILNRDLDYLARRARRFKLPFQLGRFGAVARFRRSRIRLAERWIDVQRCELSGRTVFDTWIAVQIWDVGARELAAYDMAAVAEHFELSNRGSLRDPVDGAEVRELFAEGRTALNARLLDHISASAVLAARFLPTYVAQAGVFPMLLQEICLRGTAQKVESVLLDRYYHAKASLPDFPAVETFEGGFSKSFQEGLFREVFHFDVASLYPSLLLQIGRNPASDHEGVFIPLLRQLREYRLKYKKLAVESTDPVERAEFNARQASFKILINSFYGYLGFRGARFADGELAAEVTRRGRELLQSLVASFQEAGCTVLEADTDGLYVHAPSTEPDVLLHTVTQGMPEGIDLEFGGRYEAMFCYKAKNYALFDGEHVIIRGSALRSRGMEPVLSELTRTFVNWILGADSPSPVERLNALRRAIEARTLPVEQLAKSENLSMAPAVYASKMAAGGKPRRAALEVALRMSPVPRMGDRVHYYLREKRKGETSDWQRAEPLDAFNPQTTPYDSRVYLRKLDEWWNRYQSFIERPSS